MRVNLDNGNANVVQTDIGYEITIPSKKNIFVIIFLLVWTCGWFIGEATVIMVLFKSPFVLFLLLWLVGWTIGGAFAIGLLAWMLFGKEVIYYNRQSIVLEKRILFLKKISDYDLMHVKAFVLNEQLNLIFTGRNSLDYYGITGGKIKFDYGMKTILFGSNIDSAEAKYLLENIFSVERI